MPRVSVIVPAYNAAETLARTLASIEAQAFGDWEAIVVDDGSADGTADVARAFADPRIRVVVSERNVGLASARNLGIERARGDLIALLDSDDAWLPEYLSEQVAAFEDAAARRPGVGIVACDAWIVGPDGHRDGRYLDRFPPPAEVTVEALLDGNPVFISVLVARRVLDAVGAFAPGMRSCEDQDLWLRAVEAGFEIVIVPRPLVLYTVAPGQLSADPVGMAAGAAEMLRRALARGRLTRRQRLRARRRLRLHRAVSLAAGVVQRRAEPGVAGGRVAAALPLLVVVALENPRRWAVWVRRAGAWRRVAWPPGARDGRR